MLKGMGVKAGAPDLIVFWRNPGFVIPRIMFIEVKAENGRLSTPQRAFADKLEKCGFGYYIVYSVDDMASICRDEGLVK